jgi:recombinational DNA repair ATPase RecF
VLAIADSVVASIPVSDALKLFTTQKRLTLNIIRQFMKIVRKAEWHELNSQSRTDTELRKAAMEKEVGDEIASYREQSLAECESEIIARREAAVADMQAWAERVEKALRERFETGYAKMVNDLSTRLKKKIASDLRQVRTSGIKDQLANVDADVSSFAEEIVSEMLKEM